MSESESLSRVGINPTITIKYNGDAFLNLVEGEFFANKYGTNYKVATNIVNAGIQAFGQDNTIMLWFINESGKFSYIQITPDGATDNLNIKEIENLKNIVDVKVAYNGEANIPVAIDIDGNILDINF